MSLPENYDTRAEIVGFIDLVEIDTTVGVFNFIVGQDGWFKSSDGRTWVGSKLISCSEIEFSINGSAPGVELGLTFIQDPDEPDLIAEIRDLGEDVIKNREARFYIQYLQNYEEYYAPAYPPQLITRRTMMNLTYAFDGPQSRRISLQVEGPFNLRSRPVGGRYNTVDHSRRLGLAPGVINPSLEFMPVHSVDEQSLFGI